MRDELSTHNFPSVTVLREAPRRARFPHTCNICRLTIPAGEPYHYIVYLDEDTLGPRFRTARYHLSCPVGD